MRATEGVPQTADEAQRWGWDWLRAECLACRRVRDLPLVQLPPRHRWGPLARYAGRLVCSACGSRELSFSLGAREKFTLAAFYKPIAFRGLDAVHPPRG